MNSQTPVSGQLVVSGGVASSLVDAARAIASLREPSIADLLTRSGYPWEAGRVRALVDAVGAGGGDRLLAAARAITIMRHPSVAVLLRRRGYITEAVCVEALVAAVPPVGEGAGPRG